ncbi:MAG: cell envelope biogenesis protein TolA [Rhodobacter sp.]|nr:cell envelope biogenesis protein TolA [Rhodobacter sp.]
MNTGQIISGAGHAGLILWAVAGGFFNPSRDVPEVAVTSVSLLSARQYEELAAAAMGKPDVPAVVDQPAPAEPVLDPVVSPRPEAKPRTEPAPEPRPEPLQESAPDVSQIEPLAVPEEVAAPEPLAQVADAEQPLLVPDSEEAKPQDAPRVAPVPAETPEPDAEVAEMPTPSVSPDAAPDAPVVQEDRPEAAPEAATTQIITEAVETTDKPELAPTSSARPRTKPPARTAETPEAEAPAAEAEAPATAEAVAEAPPVPEEDSIADAVAAAISEAEAEPAGTNGTVEDAGPPMTDGEKDALRVAVQACWNVGTLSSDALLTTVTLGVTVARNGIPDTASIRMIGFEGGSEASARQAYEAARRAIVRCGARGFQLPPEKYEQWRNIEMTFNPEKMRIK